MTKVADNSSLGMKLKSEDMDKFDIALFDTIEYDSKSALRVYAAIINVRQVQILYAAVEVVRGVFNHRSICKVTGLLIL